ncbi:DUF6339 family protein [Cupriavidus sp. UGS-1]|uniref:DUF6339 family protein n=1 Tax=Cupriavidus sp. UGS-1 TaxID=2899826 RepID=UPI001E62D354|nr:DUF6339 family protein [Cupriavidus sp. UGS-1]MCD9122284.1 DUF6339 family protein [Cupriavidus sp. UGS-1]
MASEALKFLSEAKLQQLYEDISTNRQRYKIGDFKDLLGDNGWEIESSVVRIDREKFSMLDGAEETAEAYVRNSLLVHQALEGMTPAIAREERVWVRLTHIECIDYTRARWLRKIKDDQLDKSVALHFFAQGRTGVRDDNAVSKLWWNVHIAKIADPSDPEGTLRLILKTADIRQAFVERPGTAARGPLAKAVVRAMKSISWLTSTEAAFRQFMIALNRDGGGVLFEALTQNEADRLVASCVAKAEIHLSRGT